MDNVIQFNKDAGKDILNNNENKLSYEQLKELTLQQENMLKHMYERIRELDMANVFKRLDYLFKVIENKDSFNSDFIIACSDEIVDLMTIRDNNDSNVQNNSSADKESE